MRAGVLDNSSSRAYNYDILRSKQERLPCRVGDVAQLGERLTGSQKVVGSIPIISTIEAVKQKPLGEFFERLFLLCREDRAIAYV